MTTIHLLNNPHDKRSQDFCNQHSHKYDVVNWYSDEQMMYHHIRDYPPFRSLPCVLVHHNAYTTTIINDGNIETTFEVPAGHCYFEPTDDTDAAIVQGINQLGDWEINGKTIIV